MNGWIGVDLDGTLAKYDKFEGPAIIGAPIPAMVERVKRWLAEGRDVRIFTARVYPLGTEAAQYPQNEARVTEAMNAINAIYAWCVEHIGYVLPVTCMKDYGMLELWDDRAVQVKTNTGEPVGTSTRGLQ